MQMLYTYEIWILQLDAWIHSVFQICVIKNNYHLYNLWYVPKGRENWLPEANIFASLYKQSLKIWNPTVMKYVEEQRLVGIKNAHALRLWNLDIATWCMNSFYIALSNWQTLHKWNVMKYDESKKISQASKAAITLRICTMMVTYIFEVSPFPMAQNLCFQT